jgi:hypothetical protein
MKSSLKNVKSFLFPVLLLLTFALQGKAQTDRDRMEQNQADPMQVQTDRSPMQQDTGSVIVNKDPRIDLLIKKQIQINEATTRERRRMVPGFRIQVISTTDRNKAIEAKTKIYKVFPELKPYFLYQSPYYRLKVGNFLTREEAQEYINTLSREFPGGGVFIVRDTIERDPVDN